MQVGVECKDEEKSNIDVAMEQATHVKLECKKEDGSVKVKLEPGLEPKVECKAQNNQNGSVKVKAEGSTKCKKEVKKDTANGVRTSVEMKVKRERGSWKSTEAVAIKRELPSSQASFAVRLPLWIQMCKDFQEQKKTWAPARPCCLPNCLLEPRAAPLRHERKACYHRLNKAQRFQFRAWIEGMSEASEPKFTNDTLPDLVHDLL